MQDFMELSQKPLLNTGHRFCEMELEHMERFLGLSRHFTAVALVVAIVGVAPHFSRMLQKLFEVLPPVV
jgi:hypothetical protein